MATLPAQGDSLAMKTKKMIEAVARGHAADAVLENAIALGMMPMSSSLASRHKLTKEGDQNDASPLVDMGTGGGQDSFDNDMVAADAPVDGSSYAGADFIDGEGDVGGPEADQDAADNNVPGEGSGEGRKARRGKRTEGEFPWDDDEDDEEDEDDMDYEARIIDKAIKGEGLPWEDDPEDDDEDKDEKKRPRREKSRSRRRR